MSRKWLRNNVLIVGIFISISSFSQRTDTLKTFVKEEVLTPLTSFSSIELVIDSSDFTGLDELLEQNSPVYLKNYGQGQLATLSIRGNGTSQTQLFWNGFKMNSPTLGQTDLSLMPSFFINSATLNYSGGSSVNGSGGIGGSLDLANQLKWRNGLHASYGKQISSFGNSASTLGISFGGKKVFQQLKFLIRKGENNFPFIDISNINKPTVDQVNNDLFQLGGQYEIGVRLNDKNLLHGTILYIDSYRELPPVLGAVSNNEFQEDKNLRSFFSWKSFQKKIATDTRVSFFKEKLDYTDSNSGIFSVVDIDTYQAQFRAKFKILKAFDIETSIQNSFSQVNSTGFSEPKQRNEAGLYLKISETLEKLYYEVYGRQEVIDENFSPIVFGGGLVFKPFKNNFRFKGNLSSNYRVPTLNDLYWTQAGNLGLLPEKGWSGEVGVEQKRTLSYSAHSDRERGLIGTFKSEISLGLTGFINQTDNWIQWIPTETGIWSPKNVKQIENKGIEAHLAYFFKANLTRVQAKLFYTYTHSRNKEFSIQNAETVNKIPIYIPAHKANGLLSCSWNKLTVFYSQIYNGRVFIDESNSTYLPHYFPANIGLSYSNKFRKLNYRLGGRVNNLYNEPYQVVANRPIPGRNYSLNLTLSF